jgi:hypothetical protein
MLSTNSSLAHLNVSNNVITAKGAVVVADGIFKNECIKSLQVKPCSPLVLRCGLLCSYGIVLWLCGVPCQFLSLCAIAPLRACKINSNPLGSDGARAIMRAMRNHDSTEQRSIGIEGCTLHNVVVFDPTKPAGTYSLDLSKAYDRVRFVTCRVAVWAHGA